jgi:hypothetical protein
VRLLAIQSYLLGLFFVNTFIFYCFYFIYYFLITLTVVGLFFQWPGVSYASQTLSIRGKLRQSLSPADEKVDFPKLVLVWW